MPHRLVLFLYQSWSDLDDAVGGLTYEEATTRSHGGSSIAWTLGHVTHMLDSWMNKNFQGLAQNPILSRPDFRTGGSGDSEDWPVILAAVSEVRETAKEFLDQMEESDLDRVIPYEGSIEFLRPIGLRLGYAVMRIAAHHFMHAGEIRTVRSAMGHTLVEGPDWGRSLAQSQA